MPELQPNEYKCAMCGNVYTKGRTDEEAMKETQSYWPGVDQQDCAAVCDDCYQQIRPATHPEVYQETFIDEEPFGEIIQKIIMRACNAMIFGE